MAAAIKSYKDNKSKRLSIGLQSFMSRMYTNPLVTKIARTMTAAELPIVIILVRSSSNNSCVTLQEV